MQKNFRKYFIFGDVYTFTSLIFSKSCMVMEKNMCIRTVHGKKSNLKTCILYVVLFPG